MKDAAKKQGIDGESSKINSHAKRAALVLLCSIYFSLSLYQNPNYIHVLSKSTNGLTKVAKANHHHKLLSGKKNNVEPYVNRWQRRFSSSDSRNATGKYLFFKHIRKAGGTSLRSYFHDVFDYHGLTRNMQEFQRSKNKTWKENKNIIHYIEQEFQTMDWQCPNADPRWNDSLRIITLRHPIERHISEFFFSGPGAHFPIDRQQLYINETYTDELSSFLKENLPKWMARVGHGELNRGNPNKGLEGSFNGIFGRFYVDNFQLRALAGCSSKECLEEKNIKDSQMVKEIQEQHPSVTSYSTPNARCTSFFKKPAVLFEVCSKNKKDECMGGCDGPCFYPSVAWGKMGPKDVTRALKALESFDVVLLMETFDDADQSSFLADVLGVPRDAKFSLQRRNATNSRIEKTNKREKTNFYRDMLRKLSPKVLDSLVSENAMEIEFFNHAVAINEIKTDLWKRETKWSIN